jgi:hypothetical protein
LTKRLPNRLLSSAAQNLRSSPAVAEQLLRAYFSISPHLPCFRLGMRFALKPLANLWRRLLQWFFRN